MSRIVRFTALAAFAATTVLGGASIASADSGAHGVAAGSPGVLSGNVTQVPVHIPVNVCGNSVSALGALNPAFGNTCVNGSGHHWGKKHDDKWGGKHHNMERKHAGWNRR
ncbi:chaplin [Streptomyces sp. Pv4-95]|uniref:chaplin n=1 Tax=Streptomyces sp. Pv4-95 TaxID=3049543 RepID=UPI0038929C32